VYHPEPVAFFAVHRSLSRDEVSQITAPAPRC
jgi:hypothetical protein